MKRLLTLILFCVAFVPSSWAQFEKENIHKKMSAALSKKLQSANSIDSIDVYISYSGNDSLIHNFRLLSSYKAGNVSLIRIKVSDIQRLLKQSPIRFADAYVTPKEELTTGTLDLATNKVNLAQSEFATVTGKDLFISLKENKPDTTDLDFIGRYFNTGLSAAIVSPHATIMATTIAGAGNTSSFGKGVAPGSYLTSSSFAIVLPDNDVIFQQNGITVQNHSYGTVVQNYYGVEAAAYDVSAINNPRLLHVFSSGNSGNQIGTGTYTGVEGYANLTGNFKLSKNTIAVGAIDSFYNISPLSSKGPAYDGRMKPELMAFGEDGSSGAAAMVSGSALLIQQAYKMKFGVLPTSASTKAILITSATDVGAKGIDFASGFGNLNTYHAIKAVAEGRVMESTINANNKKSIQVVVPNNAAFLKVTMVWTDPPAAANAPKALVNDLDMVVKAPDNSLWLPWVLNSTPAKASIELAAVRKKDTLNNVEQITIEAPAAGTYTIEVAATELQNNQQDFSIAYQVDTLETIRWTFPSADTKIEANTTSVIRWETNKTGPASIEYSTDKVTWASVATVPTAATGYYKWAVPNVSTIAWLRLSINGTSAISDTFVISSIPRMTVGFNCADSFLLLWNKQPVESYQVYKLDDKYLQVFASTTDTFSLLKKSQNAAIYYTVAPVINGKTGLQAAILNYNAQGVDCYFKNFFLQNQTGTTATLFAAIGTTYGVAAVILQKKEGDGFRNIKTINRPTVSEFNLEDPALKQGGNQYRIALQLTNGQTIYGSELVNVYYFNDKNVIIYPNPASQQQPIHIITSRAGRTTIQLYSSNGALLSEMRLKDLSQQIPPLRLNTGLYFIKIIDEESGAITSQKIVVY